MCRIGASLIVTVPGLTLISGHLIVQSTYSILDLYLQEVLRGALPMCQLRVCASVGIGLEYWSGQTWGGHQEGSLDGDPLHWVTILIRLC